MRVYFALMQIGEISLVKIGQSFDPARRVSDLSNSLPFDVFLIAESDNLIEERVHRKFRHLQLKHEWFYFTDEIKEFIQKQCVQSYEERDVFSVNLEITIVEKINKVSLGLGDFNKSEVLNLAINFALSDIKALKNFVKQRRRQGIQERCVRSITVGINKKIFDDLWGHLIFSNRKELIEDSFNFAYENNNGWQSLEIPEQDLWDFTTAKRRVANET